MARRDAEHFQRPVGQPGAATRFFTSAAVGGPVERNAQGIPVTMEYAQAPRTPFRDRNVISPTGVAQTFGVDPTMHSFRRAEQMRRQSGGRHASAFGDSLRDTNPWESARAGSGFGRRSLTRRDELGSKMSDIKDMSPMERAKYEGLKQGLTHGRTQEERAAHRASLENIRKMQEIAEAPRKEAREVRRAGDLRASERETARIRQKEYELKRDKYETDLEQKAYDNYLKLQEAAATGSAAELKKAEKEVKDRRKTYHTQFFNKSMQANRRERLFDAVGQYPEDDFSESGESFTRKAEVFGAEMEQSLFDYARQVNDAGEDGAYAANQAFETYIQLEQTWRANNEFTPQEEKTWRYLTLPRQSGGLGFPVFEDQPLQQSIP